VLVARDQARMELLATRLRAEAQVAVDVLPADLTQQADLAKVEARLREDASIGILVNNAGMGQSGAFVQQSPDSIDRLVMLNTTVPTRLAAAVAPRFAQAGQGAIVNIGSVVGFAPAGYDHLRRHQGLCAVPVPGLHVELGAKGVYVQAVLPPPPARKSGAAPALTSTPCRR
jgi:short-subunit dehydrogenase